MSAKCNHLVPKYDQDKKCVQSDPNSKTHYWISTGRIEVVFSTVQVDFMCKYCNKRTTSFLSNEQFEINKSLLGA